MDPKRDNLEFKIHNSKLAATVWWLLTASVVAALLLRFAMRAVGIRDDITFPHVVYALTTPLVQPLYRFFPATGARFDYPAIEAASLAAAGVVLAVAVIVYAAGLLTFVLIRERINQPL